MIKLPVDDHLANLHEQLLKHDALVVEAPPGTGKTTRVPAYLAFDCGLKVVVLEPRRIAARQAAARVAQERGVGHGREVGHAFRFEANWNDQTRLLFATEGTFLRLLEKNAFAADVVILDEFHERHLESDLALALLSCRQEKIIVMSATLEGLDLLSHFETCQKNASKLQVPSPLFPLEVRYLENNPSVLNKKIELLVLDALEAAFAFGGDILVFLPGLAEIERTRDIIQAAYEEVEVLSLHGKLDVSEQVKVFAPSKYKKIILSTNIAESSVTIPGVKVVIDSGLAKQEVRNPVSGLSVLETVKIAKSNAIQRAGRAAREAEGLCLRLYSAYDFEQRDKAIVAEIERHSLESVCLSLFALKADYHWFEAPHKSSWQEALLNLKLLGAIDENEKITELGQRLHLLPLEPKWGRVVLAAQNCDLETRKELFYFLGQQFGEHSQVLRRRLESFIAKPGDKKIPLEQLLLSGFVTSLAKLNGDIVNTVSGKVLRLNAKLQRELAGNEWGIVFDADSFGRINTFCAIDVDWLFELEPLPFTELKLLEWSEGLVLVDRLNIGSLTVEESRRALNLEQVPAQLREQAQNLLVKSQEKKLKTLLEEERFHRLNFAHKEANSNQLDQHISQFLSSGEEFTADNFFTFLEGMAFEVLGGAIDTLVPWQINGLKIVYSATEPPHIMAYIQAFYGQKNSPVLPLTRKPVTLKLQGPHKRPLQVTNDLAGFWQRGYRELLKEMRREYPRHHWPDDPEKAPPVLLKRQLPS